MSGSNTTPKLTRRPTWPALNLLTPSMSKAKAQTIVQQSDGDMDEDPFSHFLSPVLDDEDPFDDDEFTAGITPYEDEIETKRTNFRTRIGERWETFMARPKQRPRTPPDEDQMPDLETDDLDALRSPQGSPPDMTMLDEELDGWEADRARQRRTFGFPLLRPRLKTSRTLSGRKHSWAEPSADLWTVDEDDENDTVRPIGRGRDKQRRR